MDEWKIGRLIDKRERNTFPYSRILKFPSVSRMKSENHHLATTIVIIISGKS